MSPGRADGRARAVLVGECAADALQLLCARADAKGDAVTVAMFTPAQKRALYAMRQARGICTRCGVAAVHGRYDACLGCRRTNARAVARRAPRRRAA